MYFLRQIMFFFVKFHQDTSNKERRLVEFNIHTVVKKKEGATASKLLELVWTDARTKTKMDSKGASITFLAVNEINRCKLASLLLYWLFWL